MNAALAAGLTLTALGTAGSPARVFFTYPGRSFSLTALMASITLAATGRALTGGKS
jgi:hypothetical protein